jgi:predicted PurR-regulated permease PerM
MYTVSNRLPYRAVVLALTLVAIGLLFEQLITLLLLVVIAVIVSLPLAAGADWWGRFRVPRVLGVLLTLLVGAAILAGVLALVVPAFIHQAKDFANQFPDLLTRAEHALGITPGAVSRAAQKLVNKYIHHPSTLLGPLASLGIGIASAIGGLVVVVISAIYMAISPEPLVRGLTRLAPPEHRDEFERILGRVRTAWLGWLRGIGLDMVVLGGLLFAGMKLIGLPFAVGFAVFSALMTVIPNYGSVISAVPPILYGLAQSFHEAVLVTIVYVVVNQIEGNLVLPLIMGRQVDVHPALVAIAVLIAGALFGVLGLFIAIPLMSLTIVLVQELWIRRVESSQVVRSGD